MGKTFKKYTDEMELQIVQEYLNCTSAKVLCDKYGFKTEKSILDKVKKHGFKPRAMRESKMLNKPYSNFDFAKIDSEFKAYYLGLIVADGSITSKTQIDLTLADKDAISFVATSLGKDYKRYERKPPRKPRYRLVINSEVAVNNLVERGIKPRKSKTINSVSFKEGEYRYFPYFIRVLIDGDGWIRKDGKEFFICTASKEFVEWIKFQLEERLYMKNINISCNNRGLWSARSSIQENINILKLLVYDKPFGMKRKFNLLHDKPSETIMVGL